MNKTTILDYKGKELVIDDKLKMYHGGRYLNVYLGDGEDAVMYLVLTKEGNDNLLDCYLDDSGFVNYDREEEAFTEMMEDIIGNSELMLVSAEQTGELTSTPLIIAVCSWEGEPDHETEIFSPVWAYMDYQDHNALEEILERGYIRLVQK